MTDIMTGLTSGLPLLALHFLITAALLAIGVGLHMLLTPMNERVLIAAGNGAAALSLSAATIGLALPLAATLATSRAAVDIVIWGAVGIIVQITVFAVARLFFRSLPERIAQGDVAAAAALAGWQIAIGLLNAASLAG